MTDSNNFKPRRTYLTPEARERLQNYLGCHQLYAGIGDYHNTCSLGAVNLALGNGVTDQTPTCMSEVISSWIRIIQDVIPSSVLNSDEWKKALVASVNTGNNPAAENRRIELIIKWIWEQVLPSIKHIASQEDFGPTWAYICADRTTKSVQAVLTELENKPPDHRTLRNRSNGIAEATKYIAYCTVEFKVAFALRANNPMPNFWNTLNPSKLLTNLPSW